MMNIFVSWSGERSRQLAEALCSWLQEVIQYTAPWTSGEISAGHRWSHEIAERLQRTNYGILCVTPENIHAPWIHFEAGALAKESHNSRVAPLMFGGVRSEELTGPLSQFQAKVASRSGLLELVQDINAWNSECPLKPGQIARQFDRCWAEPQAIIQAVAPDEPSANRLGRVPNANVSRTTVDKLVTDLIQTISRAVVLPRSPEQARVGASVFDLSGETLLCTHHWSPNPSEQPVGRLSFKVAPDLSSDILAVRTVLSERIEKGAVMPVPESRSGISGHVPENLRYVVAAPIFDGDGKIRGAWGFDTSEEVGEVVLSQEISDTVIHQVGEHIGNLLAFGC
jgi:hypothetical protein